MKKNLIISIGVITVIFLSFITGFIFSESDISDNVTDVFSKRNTEVKTNIKSKESSKSSKKNFQLFGPKVNIKKNKTSNIQYQTYNNGYVSMQIPKGWVVGVGKSDLIHYTFMAYDPKNPNYKIFFNMKTEGYVKTPQMKKIFTTYYKNTPMAKLPIISPQTTEGFYRVYTNAFKLDQGRFSFPIPVIKNFKPVQNLGKNMTGGSVLRATYTNEQGKISEGVFTATIKEVAMPPVVILIVYNTIYFTVPEGELVEWMPILNHCVSSIQFSDKFVSGYYKEQGQVMQNSIAIQKICNQTSEIITSGWNARQKSYDIMSQKRSDATLGYERVRDTDTGEIYKATVGFSDHDWHGKYEPITDDMYNLPTAGYIEKQ